MSEWYRCEWRPYADSVCVVFHRHRGERPQGYHATEEQARREVAAAMRERAATITDPYDRLRSELLRQAESVTRDERSR